MTARSAAQRHGYDREKAIAWIWGDISDPAVHSDDETGDMALGLFDAHVEALELPDGLIVGPHHVPVEEGIAWARPLAAKVVVRVCAGDDESRYWSAGDRPVETMNAGRGGQVSVPAWPAEGLPHLKRRRLPGYGLLDRTPDDEPIHWDVVTAVIPAFGESVAGFATELRMRLAEDRRHRLPPGRSSAPARRCRHPRRGRGARQEMRLGGRTPAAGGLSARGTRRRGSVACHRDRLADRLRCGPPHRSAG